MASVTNNFRTDLALPDGTVLPAGQTVNVPQWDNFKDNHVLNAWQKAGILKVGKAAKADDDQGGGGGGNGDEPAQLRAKLDKLGVKYHPRAGVEKLRAALEEAEKAGG